VVAIGNCGTGKTHIGVALGIEAIHKGYTVRFKRASDLVNQLNEAVSDKNMSKYLKVLNTCDLLIVDELGYLTFDIQSANLLFQVFAARYEVKSTIVTTNLEFSKWIKFLGNDEDMTSALVERLIEKSTILNMNGKGYRFK
jgi:DNA replication protein DnaC